MKSPSLDKIHSKLNKHIMLAQGYTEIEELSFIIKSCRLKPHDFIFGDTNYELILHRWWFDEFGNSLKIDSNKRLKLVLNDLSLNRDKIVCTDLYHGLSIDKIFRISKLGHFYIGKDLESGEDCSTITFLGIDNYLRSYLYSDGELQQISPLHLGLRKLKNISHHLDVKYFVEFAIKENTPIPCSPIKEWLTFLPPSDAFWKQLKEHCEDIYLVLKENND